MYACDTYNPSSNVVLVAFYLEKISLSALVALRLRDSAIHHTADLPRPPCESETSASRIRYIQ